MNAPTTEEILARLQSLEKQNRRLMLSALVPTVLLAVLILVSCLPLGATVGGDIRAKSLTIVADDGRVLASLGPKDTISNTGPDDAGELVLRQGIKGSLDEGYRIGMEAGGELRVTRERSLDGRATGTWGDGYVEISGFMAPDLTLVGRSSPRATEPEPESERGRVVISADGQFIALHDEAGKQRAAMAIKGTKTDPEQKGVFLLFNGGAAASWAQR